MTNRFLLRSRVWPLQRFKPKNALHFSLLAVAGLMGVLAIAFVYYLSTADLPIDITWQGWLSIAVTLVAFLLNAFSRLAPEIVFLGALAVLLLSGILGESDALEGFSNSGMITVGVLYVVVAGLQQTGGLSWISQRVLGRPSSPTKAMIRLMVPVIGMSAFLNNTPVVAMFIPVVNEWCRKLRISPSKLMIPLSYAAIFGGVCTLIGTSTNLVVNGLLIAETDYPSLNLLDITWVSLPCAIAGTVLLVVSQRWLLPTRKPALSDDADPRQYTVEMVVSPNSPLAGQTIAKAGLRHLPSMYLVEINRNGQLIPAVSPQEVLREHDQLVFVGAIDSVIDLHRLRGLSPATDQVFKLDVPRSERCMIEAVVSNTCPMVGRTIREGQFRSQYNAVVLAVARNGDRLSGKIGDIRLRPGDTLLLEAHPSFIEERRVSRDFYLVSDIPDSQPLEHEKAPWAIAILTLMVVLASFGVMSMLQAATLAAIAMIVLGCCSANRALKNIEWSVLLVIGAALGIGKALESTGAAGAIAELFISIAGDNPYLALAVVYGVTTIFTEVITNNAAAALVFPIALALSQNLDVSFMPFVISIMIGASASFSTPIGYQTNLMVYGPGGYKFTDFMRVGIPLNLLFWVLTVAIAPIVYPF
ncbi:MAG: SLC13 family permease [Leptolyngbyaceae bacterium]|nr:SLC13 family permease [Leptolyngbyaceae bacterium]